MEDNYFIITISQWTQGCDGKDNEGNKERMRSCAASYQIVSVAVVVGALDLSAHKRLLTRSVITLEEVKRRVQLN